MPEEVACYLCKHEPGELLFFSRDFVHHKEGRFGWNRCPRCGLIYLSPRPAPDEVDSYYPSEYTLFRSAAKQERRHWWQRPWMEYRDLNARCRAAMRVTSGGRVLDVGCGTGEFLVAMRRRGWETVGIEPAAVAARHARECFGLDVHVGVLEDTHLPADSFDVVTLWTVLEHLYDPLAALREVRRILRPDGLLITSIPNVHSLDAWWFGRYWVGYDTPRHLYVYTRDVLRLMLTQTGFDLWDMDYFQADCYTFQASLEPWLKAQLNRERLPVVLDRILKFPGRRMLTWPLFWAMNVARKGCIVTAYARPVP